MLSHHGHTDLAGVVTCALRLTLHHSAILSWPLTRPERPAFDDLMREVIMAMILIQEGASIFGS